MKKILLLLLTLFVVMALNAQNFDKYFENKTLRFDFSHCGDARSEAYFFNQLKEEPYWAGSKNGLVDNTNYGGQYLKVFDLPSGELIYSRGYNTLFNEWQTTPEAQSTPKSFAESVVLPYPKAAVRLELHARNKKGVFEKKYEQKIDPKSYFIQKNRVQYPMIELQSSGDPEHNVDIVLLPEGYSASQLEKFKADCKFFVESLFSFSPYKENRERFNVRAVLAPSIDEGVTIPGKGVWKNTVVAANFYTFDIERYQTIENFQKVRDVASSVPYDYIYVLSNTDKYGGGGIYNFYGISAASTPGRASVVYAHEFGHLLVGLGDEYVGNVSYNDMYPVDVEPWEENLTTLADFDKKQWKKMLDPNTPIPTSVCKENSNKLGVYEGGGYVTKGVYRPYISCMMNDMTQFCPVCSGAIVKMIDFLCK